LLRLKQLRQEHKREAFSLRAYLQLPPPPNGGVPSFAACLTATAHMPHQLLLQSNRPSLDLACVALYPATCSYRLRADPFCSVYSGSELPSSASGRSGLFTLTTRERRAKRRLKASVEQRVSAGLGLN
jgi:hypothetical protein